MGLACEKKAKEAVAERDGAAPPVCDEAKDPPPLLRSSGAARRAEAPSAKAEGRAVRETGAEQ